MKNEIIEDLKWFRDEYIDPRIYDSQICYDDSARKLLCTMFIEFLEEGKNFEIIEKHQEIFFKLIKQAKIERNK